MENIKFQNWSPDLKNAWNDAQKSGKELQLEVDKAAREGGVSPLDIAGPLTDMAKNFSDNS